MAPDYILINKDKQEEFIQALKEQLASFYPNGQLGDPNYTGIVSLTHYRRISNLLKGSKGSVVVGGRGDEKTLQFETTVVTGVPSDDSLMSESVIFSSEKDKRG